MHIQKVISIAIMCLALASPVLAADVNPAASANKILPSPDTTPGKKVKVDTTNTNTEKVTLVDGVITNINGNIITVTDIKKKVRKFELKSVKGIKIGDKVTSDPICEGGGSLQTDNGGWINVGGNCLGINQEYTVW